MNKGGRREIDKGERWERKRKDEKKGGKEGRKEEKI